MQTFEEWLIENHPEMLDENWRQTMGALALAGASLLPAANAQAQQPSVPRVAATQSVSQNQQATTLDQRLQGQFPKKGGGRTDDLLQADVDKFSAGDWMIVATKKDGKYAMARQVAQIRLAREYGIELDRNGFATLADNSGTITIKVYPVLKIEKGFVNVRTDEGEDVKLPLNWLSPGSQQLVNSIAAAISQ